MAALLLFGAFAATAQAKDPKAQTLPPIPHQSLTAQYGVHWGPLRIAELTLGWTLEETAYQGQLTAQTRGILAAVFKAQSVITVSGEREEQTLLARSFSTQSLFKADAFARDMVFNEDGFAGITRSVRPDDFELEREPVPIDLMRGPDPISALLESQLSRGSRIPVLTFDGVQVVETELQCDDALETLEKTRRSSFYGPAERCEVSGDVIAGDVIFDDPDQDDDIDGRAFKTIIWFAPTADGAMRVPVRVYAASERGTLKIYLRSLTDPASS